MSEYNINFDPKSTSGQSNQRDPNYMLAFFASLGVSILVAIVLAIIAMIFEAEYFLVLAIGGVIVGFPVRRMVPNASVGGAVIGAICCPLTYFLYQIIMNMFGYYYEETTSFWIALICAVLYGAYVGYNNE